MQEVDWSKDKQNITSPPLPPPPTEDDSLYNQNYNPPSPPFLHRNHDPDWVPKNYLEKGKEPENFYDDKEPQLLEDIRSTHMTIWSTNTSSVG
ncbi:abl interactor 1-like isoform X1 [Argiope bruennichi]|uniref:abl interactor 1-like isoform X1 n=1 Tax=Argiope bruennichi TaxID=94029 RepID=UPI0024951ACC|nr:abl interactor 1-like isoform X1 [Argiope bruennichi]